MVTSDADGISAHIPTDQARPGAELRVRIRDDEGSGHDILMDVRDSFFAAENVELARLEIRAVRRIDGDRTEPRAQVSDLALVHIESGESIRSGAEFDVRLSDLSGDGLAFVTTEPIREGDRMSVMTMVDGSLALDRARCTSRPAHYGRHRVGRRGARRHRSGPRATGHACPKHPGRRLAHAAVRDARGVTPSRPLR